MVQNPKNLTLSDKVGTLDQRVTIFTNGGKVIKGKIKAYDVKRKQVGLSDVTIEDQRAMGKKRTEIATVVSERDIKNMDIESPNMDRDGGSSGKSSNEKNVDQKKSKQEFCIDAEYHPKNKNDECGSHHDLEQWEHDDVVEHEETFECPNQGWNPDEMFKANAELVKSSYNGIESYSTTLPHGDDEARARADKIASEIERNEESKRCAMLENDDEERDLDKKTQFTTHVATNWRDKSSAVKTVNTYGRKPSKDRNLYRNDNRDNRRDGKSGYGPQAKQDNYQRDGHQRDGYQKNGNQRDGYQRGGYRRNSYRRNSYQKDEIDVQQRDSQPKEEETLQDGDKKTSLNPEAKEFVPMTTSTTPVASTSTFPTHIPPPVPVVGNYSQQMQQAPIYNVPIYYPHQFPVSPYTFVSPAPHVYNPAMNFYPQPVPAIQPYPYMPTVQPMYGVQPGYTYYPPSQVQMPLPPASADFARQPEAYNKFTDKQT